MPLNAPETEAGPSISADPSLAFPRSFLARRVGLVVEDDPIARGLHPAQREVLALVLQGFDNGEIGRASYRSYHTVRNHVAALRDAFDAHSVPELIVKCAARGLLEHAPDSMRSGVSVSVEPPARRRARQHP